MTKRLFTFLLMLFPIIVLADDTISFNPPTTDYSVTWLANIFGVVDGVLHGTGSQIVGRMFSVFNAAVMALGGIIITYTMLVSTMNTAHEGEMLGKKWSSIWVPVRATAGFALLVPKASGYCLLQVFVMWVVVQGVGAADKLWDEALGYLNRGGVIIETQQDPTAAMLGGTSVQALTEGAVRILSGQVCMLAVERILKNKYAKYKDTSGQLGGAKCLNPGDNSVLQGFCRAGPVPSFADSLDLKTVNDNAATATTQPSVGMPNFDATTYPFYAKLNGICGTIKWNLMDAGSLSILNAASLTKGELDTAKDARVIALQQMYADLRLVAQVIMDNDPSPAFSVSDPITPAGKVPVAPPPASPGAQKSTNHHPWARDAFGQPLDANNTPCVNSSQKCTNWGVPGGGGGLLNGTELVGSVLDYNGVIKPTLALLQQAKTGTDADANKAFIAQAKQSGWIMAGSYFFDLVKLNNVNKTASEAMTSDPNSGLDGSKFDLSSLYSDFRSPTGDDASVRCRLGSSASSVLCGVLEGKASDLYPVYSLFTGQAVVSGETLSPQPTHLDKAAITTTPIKAIPITPASTNAPQSASSVFGYAQNALVIQIPGQPPTPPLQFANMMHVDFDNTSFKMPSANFSCMGIHILFVEFCIGRMIGNIIYNDIILLLLNTITAWLESLIYGIVMNMLLMPLDAMASIFTQGMKILDVQGINPIIALAQMGTYYINFVGKLWFMLIFNQLVGYTLSIVGLPLMVVMIMAMPITIAWSLIMVGVGFITAYYVPLIPYMIFLFGSLAWFMAVIEAMVAAPIVALGVIHPEGHDIFGKGEAAIMILMNVFLRPAMMIIGFITAISLSYVGIWVLNAGFDRAVNFIQSGQSQCNEANEVGKGVDEAGAGLAGGGAGVTGMAVGAAQLAYGQTGHGATGDSGLGCLKGGGSGLSSAVPDAGTVTGGYTQWAGVFGFLFSILIYTTIYMTIVEKAFTLISALPDNILRWIGGQPERHGQESAQWAGEAKKGIEKAETESTKAMMQAGKAATAKAPKPSKGSVSAEEGGGEGGA